MDGVVHDGLWDIFSDVHMAPPTKTWRNGSTSHVRRRTLSLTKPHEGKRKSTDKVEEGEIVPTSSNQRKVTPSSRWTKG